MSYDDTDPPAPFAPLPPAILMRPIDLTRADDCEMLQTLLELAALEMTPTAGATFTRADVIALAKEIADCEIITDAYLGAVLDRSTFLRDEGNGRWSLL
jgi:hypothetical protein